MIGDRGKGRRKEERKESLKERGLEGGTVVGRMGDFMRLI
jgi:hypothetical protein